MLRLSYGRRYHGRNKPQYGEKGATKTSEVRHELSVTAVNTIISNPVYNANTRRYCRRPAQRSCC